MRLNPFEKYYRTHPRDVVLRAALEEWAGTEGMLTEIFRAEGEGFYFVGFLQFRPEWRGTHHKPTVQYVAGVAINRGRSWEEAEAALVERTVRMDYGKDVSGIGDLGFLRWVRQSLGRMTAKPIRILTNKELGRRAVQVLYLIAGSNARLDRAYRILSRDGWQPVGFIQAWADGSRVTVWGKGHPDLVAAGCL